MLLDVVYGLAPGHQAPLGVAFLGGEKGGQALRQRHVVAGDVKGAQEEKGDDAKDAEKRQVKFRTEAAHGEKARHGHQHAQPDGPGGADDGADEGKADEHQISHGVRHSEVEHGEGVDENESHVGAGGVAQKRAVAGPDGGIDETVAQAGLQRHHFHDDEEGGPESEEAQKALRLPGSLEKQGDRHRHPHRGVGPEVVEGRGTVALGEAVQEGDAGGEEEERKEKGRAVLQRPLAVFESDEINYGQQELVALDGDRTEGNVGKREIAGGLQHDEDQDIKEPARTVDHHPKNQDSSYHQC